MSGKRTMRLKVEKFLEAYHLTSEDHVGQPSFCRDALELVTPGISTVARIFNEISEKFTRFIL